MEDYDFPTKPIANGDAIVSGENYRFSVLTDGLVRCEWADDGVFEDRASTFAVNRELPVPTFRVTDVHDSLQIVTDRFHLTYDKKPFSSNGLSVNVLGKITLYTSRWRFGDYSGSLGGTARTLDNVDGRCKLGPGVVSRNGYSAIDDGDSMLFDGKGWVSERRPGERNQDIYVFCYGLDHKTAIKALYSVSGKQPILPRWALGNWWSRYYAYSADQYLALMDRFRKEEIPLSVAVLDMDWHLVDDSRVAHSGWTGYTWDDKLFPDSKAFLSELRARRLKVCPNDHPAEGIWSHEDVYEQMAKEIGHDTTLKAPIEFDSTSPKFMTAYLKMFTSLGMHFNWIDWQQGPDSKIPGVDPLWILNHYHFIENARSGRKPMIFSRYAGPGSHRYPVGFSGDAIITWASLDFQPEFTATASNIGFGWWSHDIGGHMLGTRDDEMASRWVQLGVFSPLMRLHSSNSQWTGKEPWTYTKEAQTVMSDILRFRHKLIPYLYTMNVISSREDEPLVQPLYWNWPKAKEAYKFPNQFSFGSQLLIAPITRPRDARTGLASVKAWLPPGDLRWVDIFTGNVYDPDRVISFYRPLSQYPVLAQEGSIIPLDESTSPTNGGYNPTNIEVWIVIGADAHFDLLENAEDDDLPSGSGAAERKTSLKWDQQRCVFTIEAMEGEGTTTSVPMRRSWLLRFVSTTLDLEAKLLIDGQLVQAADDFLYHETHPKAEASCIRVPPTACTAKIEIYLGRTACLSVLPLRQRLFGILNRYQVDFKLKERLWGVAMADNVSIGLKVSRLLETDADKEVLGPVTELLLADSRT